MAEFVAVAKVSDIAPGETKGVQVGSQDVCLANVDGTIYAIGGVCTHAGGPLADGYLEGNLLECPWHAGQFDVTTGEPVQMPVMDPVPHYEVQVEGDDIKVSTAPS